MRINQVAKRFKITTHALRYWEKIGVLPIIHRNGEGYREYTKLDLECVESVIMMRKAGVNIGTLIKMNTLLIQGPKTERVRKILLKNQLKQLNKKLHDIKQARNLLSWKVKHYDELNHSSLYKEVLNKIRYRATNHRKD